MDCFHDFCLACDKQCTEGSYCSQTCRLADLEKGHSSLPSSPVIATSHQIQRSSWSSTSSSASQKYASKRSSTSNPQTDYSKPLSPSSSQTSLTSSLSSSASGNGLSHQARIALQDYFSSFDQTRAAKRRPSLR